MSLPQMSVSGAVLIAVIVVVRALAIHRLPKRVFVLLWGIVLLRLLVPLSIPARMSVYSFVPEQALTDAGNVIPMGGLGSADTSVASGEGAALDEGTREPARNTFPRLPVYVLVWLTGALLTGTFFLVCYVRCRREFAMSLPVKNAFAAHWREEHRRLRRIQIRQSDQIRAPLTYGIFHPVILMPKGTNWGDEGQISCVLLHEYIHICRFDALRKLAAAAALCIHWFNPMVWVMYLLLNKDIELSCDEGVVRRLGGDARAVYAKTLIAMEERKSGLLPLYNNFSRNAIEERIKEIMRAKKLTVGITIASIALVAVIAGVFATSARADDVQGGTAKAQAAAGEPQDFGEVNRAKKDAPDDASDETDGPDNVLADASGETDGSYNALTDASGAGNGQTNAAAAGSGTAGGFGEDALTQKQDDAEISGETLVYVEAFDGKILTFDAVEWVVVPSVRAKELGIAEDDAPSGFNVYNETVLLEELPMAEECICTVLDWEGNYKSMKVSPEEFKQVLAKREGTRIPYQITVEEGAIVAIVEHYVP